MKKNYIQPSVNLVKAKLTGTLMGSNDGLYPQKSGNDGQPITDIPTGAPARIGKIYI